MRDVVTVDLAERCAQRVDACTVLPRPVGQQRSDGMLLLLEGRNSLFLITEEACQVAPVAVLHVVAVFPFVALEKQLLHFLSGMERKKQTRFFVDGHNCKEKLGTIYFILNYLLAKIDGNFLSKFCRLREAVWASSNSSLNGRYDVMTMQDI